MSTALIEAQHLEIHEAFGVGSAGPIREDGLVPLHIIRPGLGRGKGRHVYEARMLEDNAHVFKGWKMFVDHQSPEAKRAAGGLPRSVRDLGGIIKESYWDGSVPADPAKGHGQGAVIGLARPTPLIRALIETDPALVEASVSTTATGVRPTKHGGQNAWLVEGFNTKGSVDWVSLGGAGGRVAAIAEGLEESLTDEQLEREVLESMNDDELIEHIRKTRPELAAELVEAANREDIDETEEVEEVKTSIEVLTEALETPEGKDLIEALVEAKVEETFTRIAAPKLAELVEAGLEEEREMIVAEADAKANRRVELRDMRDAAHAQINETKLPDTFKAELRGRYDLVEGEPTSDLDVADDRDDKGAVTKTAAEKLKESVDAGIEAKRLQHAEIAPTAVRGQGKTATEPTDADGEKDKKDKKAETEEATTGSELTDHLLAKSGLPIDESLYEDIFA